MQCLKCKFVVDNNMKFALMKNICPACGANLFSDQELNDISLLKNRVISQSFGAEFSEELAFDVALFVINEIKNGVGQKYFQELSVRPKPVEYSEESDKADDSVDNIKEQIRKEVESEYPELQALPDKMEVRSREESEDERAKRLKEIARKASRNNKQGVSVRRVGS